MRPLFSRHWILPLVMVAGVGASAPAQPLTSWAEADDRDLACILALSMTTSQIAESQNVPVEVVQATASYFVGKIKGRHPDVKLANIVTPEYVEALNIDWSATLVRCGTELQEVGVDMTATGQALIAAHSD